MKKMVFALCIGMMIGLTANSFAATIGEKIEAVYASFNFVVNGEIKELDSLPIVINGTSYLPVRTVSNMLGYDVTYKADSRTIEFNDPDISNQMLEGDFTMTQTTGVIEIAEYNGLRSITIDGQTYFHLRDYSLKFKPISWGYDSGKEDLFLARYSDDGADILEIFETVNKNVPNAFVVHEGNSYINTSYYQEIE